MGSNFLLEHTQAFDGPSFAIEYMGVSFNGGTPKAPQMIIFCRKTHGCWVPPF